MQRRESFDETIANMFSNYDYNKDYLFYAHIIAQCRVQITENVETAGVNFKGTKYNLYINPNFFEKLELKQRMAILKHEALHILYNHLARFPLKDEVINQTKANIATDCAINQFINRDHFGDLDAIYPDTLEDAIKKEGFNVKIPKGENAETYYDLIPDKNNEEGEGKGNSNNQKDCQGNNGQYYDGLWEDLKGQIGDHEIWNEGDQGEEIDELKKEITRRMIEKATEKSRGMIPENLSEILSIWHKKAEISWQRVLKNLTSNKKVKKVPTIIKKSRRFPKRDDIYGVKRFNNFSIVVVLDVSGSMNNDDILNGLKEIKEIAKLTNSKVKIIQVDTEIHSVEDFNPKKNTFIRKGIGGTEMLPAMEYIVQNKMECDVVILISDMWIENLETWRGKNIPKVPYIFLSTSGDFPGGKEEFKARYFRLTPVKD